LNSYTLKELIKSIAQDTKMQIDFSKKLIEIILKRMNEKNE